MQLVAFRKNINSLTMSSNGLTNKKDIILIFKQLFEYLSRTKDIWWCLDKFSNTIKEKLFIMANDEPIFKEYLLDFGYICPYTECDGHICSRRLNSGKVKCPLHIFKTNKLKVIISESVEQIPLCIHNIVFEYI